MKLIVFIFLIFGLFFSSFGQESKNEIESKFQSEIKFEETHYDFGTIKEGEVVTKEFRFKNTGDSILVNLDVKTTCGCTVAEWSVLSIKPGESGTIKISFDSKGKVGRNRKSIVVISNAKNGNVVLLISGVVLGAGEPAEKVPGK